MEKHRCKLCFKNFANGRALGGHMRSHVMNLYSPPKSELQNQQQQKPDYDDDDLLTDSAPSSSSPSSSEEENEERESSLCYGLRENPKKSIKLVNPQFSFSGSVVVIQDRESETESSKNPVRRRSKRIQRSENSDYRGQKSPKKAKFEQKPGKFESPPWAAEGEPVSSISDTSPEEDVAYCLMMLSRDNWVREEREYEDEDGEREGQEPKSDDYDDQSDTNEFFRPIKSRGKGKYKCETCFKVFKSYQALGGHRASHKKARVLNNNCIVPNPTHEQPDIDARNGGNSEEKIHECPVCFRVFASGQALGGHKRSHVIGSAPATANPATVTVKSSSKFGQKLIDLNLPAPTDDDDDDDFDEVSQIELSAVSDAEFVKPIRN